MSELLESHCLQATLRTSSYLILFCCNLPSYLNCCVHQLPKARCVNLFQNETTSSESCFIILKNANLDLPLGNEQTEQML